jgi:predicted membrane protein
MDGRPEQGFRMTPQLLMGLLIIGIGIVFTLDNLGVADVRAYLRYWPAGLIALGLLKLQQGKAGGGSMGGLLFVAVGTWLLLESLAIVHISVWQLWPMLLVFFGAMMVWQGIRGRRAAAGRATDANATISGLAVLGGVSRGNNSRAFRGGDLTAVMGGCDIDLRQAAIDGEAVLDVFAMWGGIEIRVPDDWTVVGRVTPLMGGFEDKTRPPQGSSTHRLIVRGFAIMGGIEVKN